jgi:hypothetical protein
MDLARYIEELRQHVDMAATTDVDRAIVERVSGSLEVAVRLILLEALSAAASEITRDLAPGSVDLRLRGRDPEFVVSIPAAFEFANVPPEAPGRAGDRSSAHDATGPDPTAAGPDGDDSGTTRTTLRLPDQLKARVEEAAAREGVSLNAWLVRAVADALNPQQHKRNRRDTAGGDHFTGWVH